MSRRRKKIPVDECIHRLKKWYSKHRGWIDESINAYRTVEGEQWREEEELALKEAGRPVVTFNFVGAFVRGVTGAEAVNRMEATFLPVGNEDVAEVELLNLIKTYLDNRENYQSEIAHCFRDLVISGVGAGELFVYEDREGRRYIGFERRDPLLFAWDPGAQKRGIQDAWWVATWRRVHRDEVQAKWPKVKRWINDEFVDEMTHDKNLNFLKTRKLYVRNIGEGYDKRAGAHPFDPRPSDDYITVVQFQYRHHKSGNMPEEPEEDELTDFLKEPEELTGTEPNGGTEVNPPKTRPNYSIRQKLFIGTKEIEDEELLVNDFTLKAMTGPQKVDGQFYGFVQDLTSPQEWANKAYSLIIDIVASQAKGGLFAETNVFEDERRAEQDYSNPRKIIHLLPGALNKIKERQPAAFPDAIFKILETAKSSIREIAGVSLEFLGQQEDFQPGVVENMRRGSTIVLLNDYFSALRDFRLRITRLLGKMIVQYMNDGRLMRLVGDSEKPYIEANFTQDKLEFDVLVDEAPSSPDVRGKTWGVLQQIMPQLMQLGITPPIEALDYIPVPTSLRESIKNSVKAAQQAAQQQAGGGQQEIEQLTAASVQMELQKGQLDVEEKKLMLEMKKLDLEMKQMQMAGDQEVLEMKKQEIVLEVQRETQKMKLEVQRETQKMNAELEIKRLEIMEKMQEMKAQKPTTRKVALRRDGSGKLQGCILHQVGPDGSVREIQVDIDRPGKPSRKAG